MNKLNDIIRYDTLWNIEPVTKFACTRGWKVEFDFALHNTGSQHLCYTETLPPPSLPVGTEFAATLPAANMVSTVCTRFLLQRATHGLLLSSRTTPFLTRSASSHTWTRISMLWMHSFSAIDVLFIHPCCPTLVLEETSLTCFIVFTKSLDNLI